MSYSIRIILEVLPDRLAKAIGVNEACRDARYGFRGFLDRHCEEGKICAT